MKVDARSRYEAIFPNAIIIATADDADHGQQLRKEWASKVLNF